MIVTKLSLPRRTFLRGMGATLALPFLDAMVPALSAMAKTAAKPACRLGFMYVPHGVLPEFWTPKAVGAGFELTPVLSPLGSLRDHVVVASNPIIGKRILSAMATGPSTRRGGVAERRTRV
jgi:hypothetical protein